VRQPRAVLVVVPDLRQEREQEALKAPHAGRRPRRVEVPGQPGLHALPRATGHRLRPVGGQEVADHPPQHPVVDGQQDPLFRREVVRQLPAAHPGPLFDPPERQLLDPAPRDDRLGRVEDLLPPGARDFRQPLVRIPEGRHHGAEGLLTGVRFRGRSIHQKMRTRRNTRGAEAERVD
jgi:hypothetical protein